MIASLTGRVLFTYHDRVVVDVSGVGYEVFLTTAGIAGMPEKGGEVFLHIHTRMREDAITLFGFLEAEEKEMFMTLNSVSGIGPKVALGVLSGIRVDELCLAISESDAGRLTSLPGIGKKTAERICLELKDKMPQTGLQISGGAVSVGKAASAAGSTVSDCISALVNLGYPEPAARDALGRVKKRLGEDDFGQMGVEELLRETLRSLA
ncbi:MAG: Holliday junction branch migration protein RuvA [Deltaproteobacteria bacterium]|nr:MAG: Holliday junction branch migration protein RuvA [Deltaproteobacteria bacterium]